MSIGIRGIRILNVSIDLNKTDESEQGKPTGTYALMSTTDKVLAKQVFNGYGGMDIPLSLDTVKARDAFTASLKKDIETVLGVSQEEVA